MVYGPNKLIEYVTYVKLILFKYIKRLSEYFFHNKKNDMQWNRDTRMSR